MVSVNSESECMFLICCVFLVSVYDVVSDLVSIDSGSERIGLEVSAVSAERCGFDVIQVERAVDTMKFEVAEVSVLDEIDVLTLVGDVVIDGSESEFIVSERCGGHTEVQDVVRVLCEYIEMVVYLFIASGARVVCFVSDDELYIGSDLFESLGSGECLDRSDGDLVVVLIFFSFDDADISVWPDGKEFIFGLLYKFVSVCEDECGLVKLASEFGEDDGFAGPCGQADELPFRCGFEYFLDNFGLVGS